MRRRVSLARRRASFTPESRADEMVLGEEALEVFMGRSDVAHNIASDHRSAEKEEIALTTKITKDTKVKITKLERKSFFVLFVPSW